MFRTLYTLLFIVVLAWSNGQNQAARWYFGGFAGINFMTNPPSSVSGGMLSAIEGCATVSDASGNLLFYTDGMTVYTQGHAVMGNGTGLLGINSACQSCIIVKRPGSNNIYYIFTIAGISNVAGLNYSIVDMSLAAGQGSVTIKNAPLFAAPCYEKITGTRHCNGVDYWVVSHDHNSTNFRAFLVTSAGVNTTPVISPVGTAVGPPYSLGCMKISPDGKRLGMTDLTGIVDLFDFNASTGVVSNHLPLVNNFSSYGCEFSPDCSKFYAGGFGGGLGGSLRQWNLCAGSNTAIVASMYIEPTATGLWSMQLAIDGRIYCAKGNNLGVIGNPNGVGAACNYTNNGFSIAPNSTNRSIPNFITSDIVFPGSVLPPPFTYTVDNAFGCQTASFTAPPIVQNFSLIACSSVGNSLTSLQWNFGDPSSGSLNTSSLLTTSHQYASMGVYTVQLILNYVCGSDTLTQAVNINQPCISVSSTSITCANLGSATVSATGGLGPFSYTWTPTQQTSSVATGLSPGSYTITVFDFGNNLTYTAQTIFTSLIPLTGNLIHSSSITCFGVPTGTASVVNIAGGSGGEYYLWTNGVISFTTAHTHSLSAGVWSVTVTDTLTSCRIDQVFVISQPPALNLLLSASSPTACVGESISFSSTASGGTPYQSQNYYFNWHSGPAQPTHTVTNVVAGVAIYSLSITDSLNCSITSTISVNFIGKPTLSVQNASICPLQTGVVTVSGATTYTWNGTSFGNSFSDSPLSNTVYTVVGETMSCTSTATASIFIQPLPNPVFLSNTPVCNGQSLTLNGGGGASYVWSGPQGYISNAQNNIIFPAAPSNSGIYSLTVTSVNGCTASVTRTLTVYPTPSISAIGSTVCSNGTLTLNGNSVPGSVYLWYGPQGFNSTLQNPTIVSPLPARSGNYNLIVTNPLGCTNTAVAQVTVTAMPTVTISSNSPKCERSLINFFASAGDVYSWVGPNGFTSNVRFPTIPNVSSSAAGVYNLAMSYGPCTATASHTLVVYSLPIITATNTGPACETKSFELQATAGTPVISYSWQGPLFSGNQPIMQRDSSKLAYSGIYSVTVVNHNQCVETATTLVAIMQNPKITAIGDTVCLNQPATIFAEGANSYIWTGPAFYQSSMATATVPNVSKDREGTYTVVGTAANSCTSIATVFVQTRELPVPSLTVVPSNTVCLNTTINLRAHGGKSYKWLLPENIFYAGETVSFSATSPRFSDTFTLVATDELGCSNTATTHISINMLPEGSLSGKINGCVPFCSDYKLNPFGNNVLITSWQIANQTFSEGKFNYCFHREGNFELLGVLMDTVTGCQNTKKFLVEVFPKPNANFHFSPLNPVENADEVVFINTSEGIEQTSWNWHFGSVGQHSNSYQKYDSKNISKIYDEPGTFPVVLVVSNKWACTDTLIKIVNVAREFGIYVPNAFTPNGDGLNDYFVPVGRAIKSFHMQIYNRWGAKIFESKDLNSGWDGTFNSELCPNDVYTWKIVVDDFKGDRHHLTGHVSLIK